MQLVVDKRVDKFVLSLSEMDQARIAGYIGLFKQYGFSLPSKYLKKIDKNLWELRPGNIRLLLGKTNMQTVIINCFVKKSQKAPIWEIDTAKKRLKEYQL